MALTELSISTPQIIGWFSRWNKNVDYQNAVKPYNRFLHVSLIPGQVKQEEEITLVAPIGDGNSIFVNIHDPSGITYRVIARRENYPDIATLYGETYDDLIAQHGKSIEAKFTSPLEERVTRRTRGLLNRQHIIVKNVIHVGKEANEFELVQAGLVDVEENVLTTYERDLWEDLQLIVAKMSVEEIIQITGYSRRMAYMVMRGERKIAKANLLTRTYNQYDMNRRVKKASGVKVLKRMDEYD